MTSRWVGEGYIDGFNENLEERLGPGVLCFLQVYPDPVNPDYVFVAGSVCVGKEEEVFRIPLTFDPIHGIWITGLTDIGEWEYVLFRAELQVKALLRLIPIQKDLFV